MKILVPDYYTDFKCKCGECRHCCCHGWGITLSYEEYMRLLGIECSEKLRKKLDCAFFVLKDCDNERYAEVNMNYLGNCPLQSEDGYCALQCECGEKVLPKICRVYPRNTYYPVNGEGACANSCEKVVEMLFEEKNGLSFKEIEIKSKFNPEISDEILKIQKEALGFLQNRNYSLNERLIMLGEYMKVNSDKKAYGVADFCGAILDTVSEIENYSPSFSEYASVVNGDFGEYGRNPEFFFKKYKEEKIAFINNFPDYGICFENVMNNHLFFERFPTVNPGETAKDKYMELCGVYAITFFVTVAYTYRHNLKNDFVDVIAGLFRCFEHSSADSLIKSYLKRTGRYSYSFIKILLLSV